MGKIKNKEKVAEFCGAMVGDGWIQSNGRSLFLAGNLIEDKEYYDLTIGPLVTEIIAPVKPKPFDYWSVYGIGVHKKNIIKEVLSWGLKGGKKVDSASIPKWIMESDYKIKQAFVRGIFDTDGCIHMQKDYTKYADEFNSKYNTKPRMRITTISKKLIYELSEILSSLKYRHVIRSREGGFRHNRNNATSYYIEINALADIHRFFNKLKPHNPKHITKYEIWKKFGFCPSKTTLIQRKDILKNALNPYKLYAEVPERSKGQDSKSCDLVSS